MELKWVILALAVLMYVLVIVFQDKKVWFTTFAGILCIVLGMIFPGVIFGSAEGQVSRLFALTNAFGTLINWNVLMIYVGAMTIAALFLYSINAKKPKQFKIRLSHVSSPRIFFLFMQTFFPYSRHRFNSRHNTIATVIRTIW